MLKAEIASAVCFDENLRLEDWIHNLYPDLQANMDTVVALSGIKTWLNLVRVPQKGKLDMQATAENIGIPLLFTRLSGAARGRTYGLPLDSSEEQLVVAIDPWFESDDRRFTMGHELGHLYLETLGYRHSEYSPIAERFCDAVAREATIPSDVIASVTSADKEVLCTLADEYGLSVRYVMERLMRADKLPKKIAIDSGMSHIGKDEYTGIVVRTFVCINCIDDVPCNNTEGNVPVFDFSEDELWGKLQGCMNETDYFWRPKLYKALTAHYYPNGMQKVLFTKSSLGRGQLEH